MKAVDMTKKCPALPYLAADNGAAMTSKWRILQLMDQEYSLYSNTEMVNLAWVDYGCVYVFNATLTVPYHTLVEK